jgi:hypothetical protein
MFVVTAVLAILLSLAYAMAGGNKLAGSKMAVEQSQHLGISLERYKIIGALEILAVVGLLVGLAFWPLGVAASAGLILLMIGALTFHLRLGDKPAQFAPAIVLGLLAAAELIVRVASA